MRIKVVLTSVFRSDFIDSHLFVFHILLNEYEHEHLLINLIKVLEGNELERISSEYESLTENELFSFTGKM